MRAVRVLVVEDSLTIRKRLVQVLSEADGIEVVGEAADGRQGIELCQALRPDVVTLDMMLPVMTGLAATEFIMAYCPTPILIVSSSTERGELFRTYDALAAGAVDVLDKPSGHEVDDAWERRLVSTVKLVSRIRVITHVRARLSTSVPGTARLPARLTRPPDVTQPLWRPGLAAPRLLAIGASTGGPAAVSEVLRGLATPRFALPILLVIHIGVTFGGSLAEWLDGQTSLRVSHAQDGEPLPEVGEGRVLMAPPDRHLELRGGVLRLTHAAERHSCRPSVDVLFESIARECGDRAIAALLTGMGRDGAEGLLAIRRAGGATLAQDESSSVVFGMPREAIAIGGAQSVVPLKRVAPSVRALAGQDDER